MPRKLDSAIPASRTTEGSSSMPRVVVFGSSNTDMTVRVPRLPVPGQTVLGDVFHHSRRQRGQPGSRGAACWSRRGIRDRGWRR